MQNTPTYIHKQVHMALRSHMYNILPLVRRLSLAALLPPNIVHVFRCNCTHVEYTWAQPHKNLYLTLLCNHLQPGLACGWWDFEKPRPRLKARAPCSFFGQITNSFFSELPRTRFCKSLGNATCAWKMTAGRWIQASWQVNELTWVNYLLKWEKSLAIIIGCLTCFFP